MNQIQVEKDIIQEEAKNKSLQLGMLFKQVNRALNISDTLEMQYADLNISYEEHKEDFDERMMSIENKINRLVYLPVNLYQNCIQVKENCRSQLGQSNVTQCTTRYIPMNVTVSNCKFESYSI